MINYNSNFPLSVTILNFCLLLPSMLHFLQLTALSNGDITFSGGGVFVLGQDQDSRGGMFSASETFVGSMSRLNIWDRRMEEEDIKQIGTCVDSCYECQMIHNWLVLMGILQDSE